jgi:hypothetical protein
VFAARDRPIWKSIVSGLEQSEVTVADINLTQEDADFLLAMEKHKADDAVYEYPSLGGGIRVPLLSPDKREAFFLDVTRSQINLTKGYVSATIVDALRNYDIVPVTWSARDTVRQELAA